MRSYLTIFILLLFANKTFGQSLSLDWAGQFESANGFSSNQAKFLGIDLNGNIFISGSNLGLTDFDPTNGVSNLNSGTNFVPFLVKLSNSGNFIWTKQLCQQSSSNNELSGMTIDNSGNVLSIGQFSSSADFDPGPNTFTMSGTADIFVSKIDGNGNFVWAKKMGGVLQEYPYSISFDGADNVYISGYFAGTTDFDPGNGVFILSNDSIHPENFIVKLDANGNFIWAKQFYNGTNTTVFEMKGIANSNGDYYFKGAFQGTIDLDPGQATYQVSSTGGTDFYIGKLDLNGNFVWGKSIGGVGDDAIYDLCLDHQGDIICNGFFNSIVDFNPDPTISNTLTASNQSRFILKLDSTGNYVWSKVLNGNILYSSDGSSLNIDQFDNIYFFGVFGGVCDFDPGPGVYLLETAVTGGGTFPVYTRNAFLSKFNSMGNLCWAKQFNSNTASSDGGFSVDANQKIYTTGVFTDTIDIDLDTIIQNLTASLGASFITKYTQAGIMGTVYLDLNQNCIQDPNEFGLRNRTLVIQPGNLVVQTDYAGNWSIDSLSAGNYTVFFDTTTSWQTTCSVSQSFTVVSSNTFTFAPSFGCYNENSCNDPEVFLHMGRLRRGRMSKAYVMACNNYDATLPLDNAYCDITFDPLFSLISSPIPYTDLGNNTYRFQIGEIPPGQCLNFTADVFVSINAIVDQTLCVEANLFPVDSCVFDTVPFFPTDINTCTLPWDYSNLSIEGYCNNDSVIFKITNNDLFGGGDMVCYQPVRVFADSVQILLDSILLSAGQIKTFAYPATGQTWVIQTEQHPLHPGNSHPNAHIELCGNTANWIPEIVGNFPDDDADPAVDISCNPIISSCDPNDKIGYPTGISYQHFIQPNQQIQYIIRFQNTGNDTAFNVIIRDTLDYDLNVFTVNAGVASHPYSFRIYGPRVLEWTFLNILLPDSNVNEPASNGFVTFQVEQNRNLSNGTQIFNNADIYFDFNDPIITNRTLHTINNEPQIQVDAAERKDQKGNKFHIYPNPTTESSTIEFNCKSSQSGTLEIRDLLGKSILSQSISAAKGLNRIPLSINKSGIYIVTVSTKDWKEISKLVVE